ncbi:two-component system sensor histidine kinase NtrB [Bacillus massiliglaciei]|uniref:two-component system sensor histidine kinase NtrB n=1 Tax=Bacillus massiliglaciei TaxID=1816693 RepID=UPI000ADB428D|nr:ATP-binding protein [Bacillus massiliglaciei]
MLTDRRMVKNFLLTFKESIEGEWKRKVSEEFPSSANLHSKSINDFLNCLIDYIDKSKEEYEKAVECFIHKTFAGNDLASIDQIYHAYSIGRNIVFTEFIKTGPSEQDTIEFIEAINTYFDFLLIKFLHSYTAYREKRLEDQYYFISQAHRDRLTLLGQMTSSFVHEFRNPLTSIMGFVQLLQAETKEKKYLNIIAKELDQLNSRITQFLNLSKKEMAPPENDTYFLSQLVNEVIEFLYPSILEVNANITCNIMDEIQISGLKEEIRQVLLNIIMNALDVISEVSNPSIYLSSTIDSAGNLCLSISNNGPKIPDDVLPNIFDPFITTKKRGTGLGLFVCKEIIEKQKGTLTCSSTDRLTKFTIRLPIKG